MVGFQADGEELGGLAEAGGSTAGGAAVAVVRTLLGLGAWMGGGVVREVAGCVVEGFEVGGRGGIGGGGFVFFFDAVVGVGAGLAAAGAAGA